MTGARTAAVTDADAFAARWLRRALAVSVLAIAAPFLSWSIVWLRYADTTTWDHLDDVITTYLVGFGAAAALALVAIVMALAAARHRPRVLLWLLPAAALVAFAGWWFLSQHFAVVVT